MKAYSAKVWKSALAFPSEALPKLLFGAEMADRARLIRTTQSHSSATLLFEITLQPALASLHPTVVMMGHQHLLWEANTWVECAESQLGLA